MRVENNPDALSNDINAQPPLTTLLHSSQGTEIISNYAHAELEYCNIENIHTMRDSVNNLGAACLAQDHGELKQGFADHSKDSLWLRHIQLVLKASVLAAERIELNDSSVLVHCSDGWDRTSQMSATCMLLLDPYYRTLEGFAVLVEKVGRS